MKDDLINFYEVDFIKKHLPKIKDEQQEFTGMDINKHFLIAGLTGAGKSNGLLNYLFRTGKPKKGTFDMVFLVYKVDEALYKGLKDELKDKLVMFRGIENFPFCDEFPDFDPENPHQFLIIFDDVVADKETKNIKKIEQFYSYGRKKGLTVCYLSQSYFDSPKFLRKNISYLLLLTINNNQELATIIRRYIKGDVDVKKLLGMFEYAVRKPLDFLKICCIKCPNEKRFSRNFIEYLNPDDF